tara:strand:- start:573 stop:2012 length:1440 start_codon:yes stop_codon:yes gene_type:complete
MGSGYKLNYTFLGQKNEPSLGQGGAYTPLIIPSMPVPKDAPNFTSQQGQQIPASRIGSDEIGLYESRDVAQALGVTPFSRIKNYYFDKIANNNFSNMSSETIDLVKNFIWTISPQTAKTGDSDYEQATADSNRGIADEVPYIEIKEKYFLVNNIVAQALYSLTAGNQLGSNITGKDLFSNLKAAAKAAEKVVVADSTRQQLNQNGAKVSEFVDDTTRFLAEEGGMLGSLLLSFGEKTKQLITALVNYQDPDLEPVLFPYQRLYFVGPTGFKYKIPYMSPNSFNQSQTFGEGMGAIPGGDLLDKGLQAVSSIQNLANLATQAGSTYIERTKYYKYPQEDTPIEVKIPLYNTSPATYDDVCNNFKLIFLLLYQNSPLKQDKLVVEPPCIYDVKIPGMKRHPYCYLNNITVMHQGNTRVMDIDISGLTYSGGGEQLLPNGIIKAVIPDSYLINFSFAPMLTQTKNLLFTTISDHNTVTATES